MEPVRPARDNAALRHSTAIAITAISVLMLLVGLIFWHQQKENQNSKMLVRQTYNVITHIETLLGNLRDAELGKRGFLLTGEVIFLDNYYRAITDANEAYLISDSTQQHRSVAQELKLLRELTRDNPVQQSNLDELEAAVKRMLEFMDSAIEQKKRLKDKKMIPEVNFVYGKTLLDKIRGIMRVMEAEEQHLLALRIEASDAATKRNMQIELIVAVLFYLTMIAAIIAYQRTRARSLAQILQYTQDLERNEEELKMQQEELKASNEEIEAANEELEEKTKELEAQNSRIQQQTEELVTSQQQLEEKAQELERASQYKSEFLANMSHELRTPLNSLLILARMLAANEEGNLTESQIEEARVIHNGGLELLGLINDILDLSKVEAGKLSIIREPTTIEGIAQRMERQFAPVAKEKGVTFRVTVAEGLPKNLYTDAQRVEQILKNLLSNAFKFTERGSVSLTLGRPSELLTLHRAALHAGSSIVFDVTDTGIGIEPSRLKDIFEAFQQEDGSIDRHYGGTGLGLTIARKLAHMLGGEIHVTSTKGKGSSFQLILPMDNSTTEDDEHTHPAPLAAADMNIYDAKTAEFIADDRSLISDKDKVLLIIEDDAAFASTLMKIARKRGYKCLAAGDGRSGLLLAHEQPVTAIVLDLQLPDIDGMQVLEQLKHDLGTRHIPVHIISGREAEDGQPPRRMGAMGYLTKPIAQDAIEGMLARIETLLKADVKRLLVVEDDERTQFAIKTLLSKKDTTITVADTGAVGLDCLAQSSFDCIVLDLQLPDMTGFDWLDQLEQRMGESAPPVIVYTARELSEEENRRLQRHTESIIIKGARSPERLLDEVTLFLHSVESTLSSDQQEIIRMQHNPDKVLHGRTLLLVDDDLRNTFALSKLLKKHGLNIVIADNGQMALEKLENEHGIELVIMDIMMPIMDGYQTMQAIRANEAFRSLPIITLTARAMPEEQEKCMAAGANDYLTKPIDIERLLTLLRVWLFKQEMAA